MPINNRVSNVRSRLHIFSFQRGVGDKECQGDTRVLFWRQNKDGDVLADSICGTHSSPCSLKEDEVGENISVGEKGGE